MTEDKLYTPEVATHIVDRLLAVVRLDAIEKLCSLTRDTAAMSVLVSGDNIPLAIHVVIGEDAHEFALYCRCALREVMDAAYGAPSYSGTHDLGPIGKPQPEKPSNN